VTEASIFSKESRVIEAAEETASQAGFSDNPLGGPYLELLAEYKKLFRQTRRLVKMSDRMQRDLNELNAELQEHREILSRMSYLDGLTGIANRRRFNECIEAEWRRALRSGRPLAMVLMDIDFFKQYNDNYGHSAGDECLVQVARALAESVKRPGDLAARYGGEEFAVLLPETGLSGAVTVAYEVQYNIQGLSLLHEFSPIAEAVTVSMGVASMVPEAGRAYQELLDAADRQLYAAKEAGRNQIKGRTREYDTGDSGIL
jgi:diguanylate cyclase (GGDEF)-like protein